jgi:hypothetical protein
MYASPDVLTAHVHGRRGVLALLDDLPMRRAKVNGRARCRSEGEVSGVGDGAAVDGAEPRERAAFRHGDRGEQRPGGDHGARNRSWHRPAPDEPVLHRWVRRSGPSWFTARRVEGDGIPSLSHMDRCVLPPLDDRFILFLRIPSRSFPSSPDRMAK